MDRCVNRHDFRGGKWLQRHRLQEEVSIVPSRWWAIIFKKGQGSWHGTHLETEQGQESFSPNLLLRYNAHTAQFTLWPSQFSFVYMEPCRVYSSLCGFLPLVQLFWEFIYRVRLWRDHLFPGLSCLPWYGLRYLVHFVSCGHAGFGATIRINTILSPWTMLYFL